MSQVQLVPGIVYHIYNRGNNGENIFLEDRNYAYFMKLYSKYIEPITETYAYCLLHNHFHFMVRVKTLDEIYEHASSEEACSSSTSGVEGGFLEKFISKQFASFFGTYTKAFNKATSRTGTLFEGRFKRKPITNDRYFKTLVIYIHQNPQKHGLISDFRDWHFSSYQSVLSEQPTQLARDVTLSWFDGRRGLSQYHEAIGNFREISSFIDED